MTRQENAKICAKVAKLYAEIAKRFGLIAELVEMYDTDFADRARVHQASCMIAAERNLKHVATLKNQDEPKGVANGQ